MSGPGVYDGRTVKRGPGIVRNMQKKKKKLKHQGGKNTRKKVESEELKRYKRFYKLEYLR